MRELNVLQGLRNKGVRKRREIEVVLGTLLKLLAKDKLLHSGKAPVNVELRPLRKEKRGMAVQRYGTLNEATRFDGITFNFYTGLPHIYSPPVIHICPFIAKGRLDLTILKEHHVTRTSKQTSSKLHN